MVPEAWQLELISTEAREVGVLTSRQAGKSLSFALKAILTSLRFRRAISLVICPAKRQAIEILEKVYTAIEDGQLSGEINWRRTRGDQVRWLNGSRIIALPGKHGTIRGPSPNVVMFDEAAFFEKDNLFSSVTPMVARSGGQILMGSTPFGERGFFWEVMEKEAGEGWHHIRVPADKSEALSATRRPDGTPFLEYERKRIGPFWFSQEYMCRFHPAVGGLFSTDDIRAALDMGKDKVIPLLAARIGSEAGAAGEPAKKGILW